MVVLGGGAVSYERGTPVRGEGPASAGGAAAREPPRLTPRTCHPPSLSSHRGLHGYSPSKQFVLESCPLPSNVTGIGAREPPRPTSRTCHPPSHRRPHPPPPHTHLHLKTSSTFTPQTSPTSTSDPPSPQTSPTFTSRLHSPPPQTHLHLRPTFTSVLTHMHTSDFTHFQLRPHPPSHLRPHPSPQAWHLPPLHPRPLPRQVITGNFRSQRFISWY
ncbi:hypothetical protein T484DRAFT_3217925 [Baffinella frigidus]|nr:hypothetical protein T484DRAFT_3217925 [Cryptophyta sp. CCMP2293]